MLTLAPETDLEAYALRQWTSYALVMQNDTMRGENCHWRGSRIIVKTSCEPRDPLDAGGLRKHYNQ